MVPAEGSSCPGKFLLLQLPSVIVIRSGALAFAVQGVAPNSLENIHKQADRCGIKEFYPGRVNFRVDGQ